MYIYIYGVVHITYVTEHFDFKNGTSLVFAGFWPMPNDKKIGCSATL